MDGGKGGVMGEWVEKREELWGSGWRKGRSYGRVGREEGEVIGEWVEEKEELWESG